MKSMIVAVLACVFSGSVFGADWPRWRGPSGQGFTSEVGIPQAFPADGLKLLWKVDLIPDGPANSCMDNGSPSCVGGRVFVTARCGGDAGKGAETLHCIDLKDGKTVWTRAYLGGGGIADGTPTIDAAAGRIYLNKSANEGKVDGPYGIACLDAKSGEVIWSHTEKALGLPGNSGDASSVVLFEKLAISVSAKKVFAFEQESGKLAWSWPAEFAQVEKAPVDRRADGNEDAFREWYAKLDRTSIVGLKSPSTPVLAMVEGRPVMFMGVRRNADTGYCTSTVALDPATGRQLALLPWVGSFHTPVFADGLLVSSIFEGEKQLTSYAQIYYMVAYRFKWNGDTLEAAEAWRTKPVGKRYRLPSPVVVNKIIYWRDRADLYAVDLPTGKIRWSKPVLTGKQWPITSPIWADGRIFHISEEGQLRIFGDTDAGPVEILSQKICANTNATPSIVDGKLLIRDRVALYCYELAPVPGGE